MLPLSTRAFGGLGIFFDVFELSSFRSFCQLLVRKYLKLSCCSQTMICSLSSFVTVLCSVWAQMMCYWALR